MSGGKLRGVACLEGAGKLKEEDEWDDRGPVLLVQEVTADAG